ncbi:MAG: tetraacyldisaccharide 4'-kinase [Parvibaculum sp.]|nr:tetraacyldisaccharide 4'-kinase [Parvibaculum sp.]
MREPNFWKLRRDGGFSIFPSLLSPVAYIWGAAGRIKRYYARPEIAAVPVICIGNLTAGGTGKTPLALTLAERLISAGEVVHFLTRGYGGSEHGPLQVDLTRDTAKNVGDEPLLLARLAPTWVAVDRAEGAAAAARAGARVIIMDDGFQNPSLHKDFSLLVVDAHAGLGNGKIIPAGPMRERLDDALKRTSAVMIVGRGHAADSLAARARNQALPVFRAILRAKNAPDLDNKTVFAFSGIGRPEKFITTLQELHAVIAGVAEYPDHHMFSEADAQKILLKARELSAMIVTTEKDHVRLQSAPVGSARARLRDTAVSVPVRALIDDQAGLEALIGEAILHARHPKRR